MNILKNKIYLVVSKWGYPFGGGEDFMLQTMEWATNLGMRSYWLCFSNANNDDYSELDIVNTKWGLILRVPGGLSEKTILMWMKLIKPDIVHHQGHFRKNFYLVCDLLRIEFLSGYHFWGGAIELDPNTKNILIIKNKNKHKTDPEINYLLNSKYCTLYVVSKFVQNCISEVCNIHLDNIIYSGSSFEKYKINDNFTPINNKYVSVINIHKLKGGELIYNLIKNITDISFIAVKTEYGSEELDTEIEKIIAYNNLNYGTESIFMDRTDDPKIIYQKTKILLVPSLVDETFCRTANEAMMNNIPIITTGRGNLEYLIGDYPEYVIDSSDIDCWIKQIRKLYFDDNEYNKYQKHIIKQYDEYSYHKCFSMFSETIKKVICKSKNNNIMLFTPWCDQGLGIQSRNYYNILKKNGYNIFIFAIRPYNGSSSIELQKDPNEWLADHIYYSKNDREHVTDIEIIEFIKKYNVGKCIIPETCWYRIFEIASLLRLNNVKTFAIPNIEIVRKDEIFKHKIFDTIICNNYLCKNIFNSHNINNTVYVGYGLPNTQNIIKKLDFSDIQFLFIGGMNAFSRKNILLICEAFDILTQKYKNIYLTCTIQKINMLESEQVNLITKFSKNPQIKIIQDHLTYSDITELYLKSHISIQVSKHEGLGLGFYEALHYITPVLTLDIAPHNEIILDGINGWTIPCIQTKMIDNGDPLYDSAIFDPNILANKISNILDNTKFESYYNNIIDKLREDYNSRLNFDSFVNRFTDSLS